MSPQRSHSSAHHAPAYRLLGAWRYPTLYESQVVTREDSPVHRGVFVRRALELIEGGTVERSEVTLPRLVSLVRLGEPIPITHGSAMAVALDIAPGSVLDGHTVASGIGQTEVTTAVAVLRGEEMLLARGPTELAGGDQLIAVATPAGYERLRELAVSPASQLPDLSSFDMFPE